MNYQTYYQESIDNPESFWKKQADKLKWYRNPSETLTKSADKPYTWFKDGVLNTCYLCLDRHVEEGNGTRTALIYDSPVTSVKKHYSYEEMRNETAKTAGMLKNLGISKGDRVIIYMPMIPEAIIAMLACARLGAVHSVVFGGFAPHELQVRIDDAHPKVLLTATCGIEFTKVIPYLPMVETAVKDSKYPPAHVIVFDREQYPITTLPSYARRWQDELMKAGSAPCTEVTGNDPLYILYTSGTTGKPKGVVRENGGHAVALNFSMEYTYDCRPGEVFWAASDIGWVVGHSYIVYAPLLRGCTTICYEGKPIKTPDAGAFWRVINEYAVNHFFTAPTAFRAIKKEDPEAQLLKKYDISCLKRIYVAGERMDPPTYQWLTDISRKPVLDHWWQTETGWSIVANPIAVDKKPIKTGSSSLPMMKGTDVPAGKSGNIVIRLPMPPGCLNTLWNNYEGFYKSYLETYAGYYLTGDGGYIDTDGYVFIMGRIDDVINVSGHRLSTGEMEEIIGSHPAIAECAVVGIEDELKGQVPVGFFVVKDGADKSEEDIEKELVALIRDQIGAVAVFKKASKVKRLPKTRSGKILRKTIRRLADERDVPVPPTIDDPLILDELREVMPTDIAELSKVLLVRLGRQETKKTARA
ncbi:hypothetical protein CHS0354_002046 [Potamilus streckersoni]|uniref:Acyl-CoA synthetase short-chain family member 3, mitochondrial n=1 Tax=Potamilus streckersoni TaxID=2493646 RepID=A0AAE0T6S9_9BIVA|nr:hypothetical protein CHS0354_002046 [Potamilus streckersoni]